LAGAIKDNKRGIILGTQSFGKGSVQSVIPLPDGSGLRLTTSKYFTPSGASIHGEGITPDIIVKLFIPPEEEKDEKEKNIDKVFNDLEEKDAKDSENLKLSKKEAEVRERLLTDNQVRAAINVLKGIHVFQGFGATTNEQIESAAQQSGSSGT